MLTQSSCTRDLYSFIKMRSAMVIGGSLPCPTLLGVVFNRREYEIPWSMVVEGEVAVAVSQSTLRGTGSGGGSRDGGGKSDNDDQRSESVIHSPYSRSGR